MRFSGLFDRDRPTGIAKIDFLMFQRDERWRFSPRAFIPAPRRREASMNVVRWSVIFFEDGVPGGLEFHGKNLAL